VKRAMLIIPATIALIALTATATACKTTGTKATVEVAADTFAATSQVSRNIPVSVGADLTVLLASNATTGFQWNEQAQIADTTILEQTGHRYIAPTTTLAGAGGQEEWTFKALKEGTTTVYMEYSRPWAGGEKGVYTFTLTVPVNK
jgi:predicted secreted protein